MGVPPGAGVAGGAGRGGRGGGSGVASAAGGGDGGVAGAAARGEGDAPDGLRHWVGVSQPRLWCDLKPCVLQRRGVAGVLVGGWGGGGEGGGREHEV